MKSLRRHLMLTMTGTMTAVTLATSLWSYLASREEIEELFDAQLAQHSRIIQQTMNIPDTDAGPMVIEQAGRHSDDAAPLVGHKYEAKIGFQIWQEGRLLARTENMPDTAIAAFKVGFQNLEQQRHHWRAFAHQDPTTGRWYISAERIGIRQELISKIATQSILPMLIGAPLAMALIWLLLGHGLRPLRHIADELNQRHGEDFSPIGNNKPSPEELTAVMQSVNSLFERLNDAFSRERRFTADAAHELKTPIATARLQLENAIATSPENITLGKLNAQIQYLQHIVEQLLTLSRAGPAGAWPANEQVDLRELATETIEALLDNANAKHQDLGLDIEENASLMASHTALAILLRNLVQNAILYTPDDGRITIRLSRTARTAIIEIIDSGPGIAPELRQRAFDRFYRAGGDTHSSGQIGSGLGLAIAKEIVQRCNGQIALLDAEPPPGLRVRVELPIT